MEEKKQGKSFQAIDIKEVVRNKSQKLAHRVPAFVYRWLSKLLHLDEINDFTSKHYHLSAFDFVDEGIKFIGADYEVSGEENIPLNKRFICVSNHPLGGLDGLVLIKIIFAKTGTAHSLANDFIMAVEPLHPLFVPINKLGGQARGSIEAVEQLYQSNDNIVIFPAGLCSRKIRGKIEDLTWQKHFVQKAIKHQLDVLPVYFEGRNTNRFYNLARLRKFLGVKFNFEMMFLVDEMFKQRGKTFKIHIGTPISHKIFDKSKKQIEWAEYIKNIVYSLKKTN